MSSIASTECPVCRETYVDPRSLSCGHAVCLQCANELYSLQILRRKIHMELPSELLKNQRQQRQVQLEQQKQKIENLNQTVDENVAEIKDNDEKMVQESEEARNVSTNIEEKFNVNINGDNETDQNDDTIEAIYQIKLQENTEATHSTTKNEEQLKECVDLRCPVCDRFTFIPIDISPASQLPVNEKVKKQVDIYLRSPCGHECGRQAVCDCLSCKISFCDECWTNVHKGGMSRHRKLNLHSLDAFQHCNRHAEIMDFFCKDCNELVCYKCAQYGVHKSPHKTLPVEDYAEQLQNQNLRPNGENLKLKIKKFENAMQQVLNRENLLRTSHEEIDNVIISEFDKLNQFLLQCKDDLLNISKVVKKTKEIELTRQLEALQSITGTLKKTVSHLDSVLADAVDENLQSQKAVTAYRLIDMQQRLAYLSKHIDGNDIRLEPCCTVEYEPKIDISTIMKRISELGEYMLDTEAERNRKTRKLSIAEKIKESISDVRQSQSKSDDEEPVSAVSVSHYQADDEHKTPIPNKDLKRKLQHTIFERPRAQPAKKRKINRTQLVSNKHSSSEDEDIEEMNSQSSSSSSEDEDIKVSGGIRLSENKSDGLVVSSEDDDDDE